MCESLRPISPGAESLLNKYFPVLDYGFCALLDYCGNDAAIAQAARCSYGAGTKTTSDDEKLIRYLIRHRHTSPLEQVEMKFHMRLPIFVARQLVRHRTASLNEYSGRYSVMPLQFYTPQVENLKAQSKSNKQGRDGELGNDVINDFYEDSIYVRKEVSDMYSLAIEGGVARELARIDLPLSTYTEWYWKMDLHNLLHMLGLRADSHAQWEIREFANVMAAMVKICFPMAFEGWLDQAYCARTFSYQEMRILQTMIFELEQNRPSNVDLPVLGKREQDEFREKIYNSIEKPKFKLDMSTAKTPEYFADLAQQFIPSVDGAK